MKEGEKYLKMEEVKVMEMEDATYSISLCVIYDSNQQFESD
jgi:hypothetical protein